MTLLLILLTIAKIITPKTFWKVLAIYYIVIALPVGYFIGWYVNLLSQF